MARATIIIPFKDAASTIEDCLESVSRQTEADFEALFIDDGSTDASPAIVAEAARKDSRICLLANPGAGLVSALNSGIQKASAEALIRMDADDIMHPARLELQLEHLRSVDISSCQVALIGSAGAGMKEYIRWQNSLLSESQIRAHRYVECPVLHPTIAFRASLLPQNGMLYSEGPFPEDYELVLRWINLGCSIQKVPETLLQHRCHDRQLSRLDPRYNRSAFHELRKRFLRDDTWLQNRLQEKPAVVWGASRQSRRRFEDHFPGLQPAYFVDIKPSLLAAHRMSVGCARLSSERASPNAGPGQIAGEGQQPWTMPGVRSPEQLFADASRPFVLVYVNSRGARPIIESALDKNAYSAGEDYICIG